MADWAEQFLLVGVDEAGRGPLAGPVVAAAVVFPPECRLITGLRDSKLLPAGVFFMHYPSGRPILVNVRARQLLGQREDTAAGLAQFAEVYRLFRTDGTPYPVDELPVSIALTHNVTAMRDDIVVHRHDGRRIPLVAWASPIDLSGRGEPDAAVCVFEDLTNLRQAEVARRDSQDRLRAVVETMEECLIVLNAKGNIE